MLLVSPLSCPILSNVGNTQSHKATELETYRERGQVKASVAWLGQSRRVSVSCLTRLIPVPLGVPPLRHPSPPPPPSPPSVRPCVPFPCPPFPRARLVSPLRLLRWHGQKIRSKSRTVPDQSPPHATLRRGEGRCQAISLPC